MGTVVFVPFPIYSLVSIHEPKFYDLSLHPLVQREYEWLSVREFSDYWEYIHNPVFLAEEISFEAVSSRESHRVIGIQGAYADYDIDMRQVIIPLNIIELDFSILFGNIVVEIRTVGLIAQQVWDMLEGIL